MADNNTLRSFRSNDPYSRRSNDADESLIGGGDPLAELARLIGQPDPFHDTVRRQPPAGRQTQTARQPEPPPQAQTQPAQPAVDHHTAVDHGGNWGQQAERSGYDEPAYDPDPRYSPSDLDGAAYPTAAHGDEHYNDPRYHNAHADYRQGQSSDAPQYPEEPQYSESQYYSEQQYPAEQQYSDEQLYADAQDRTGYADEHYHRGMKPPSDEDYDDPPRRSRSGSSLVTASVLIGCAILGTAGAYAYRTYSSSAASGQAPVIIADSAPSKIVPNTEQKSTRSQDRVTPGDERLVSREEQPVPLPGSSSSTPRAAFPSPAQPAPTTTGSTSTNAQSSTTDQPKRVRTVPIRPDGGDASGRPTGEAAPAPATARNAPPPAAHPPQAAPLSLDPAQTSDPPVRAQQQPAARVAALPPANTNVGTGSGYLVQVSSQRSEADAQASYRALQGKYSQLKSRQAIIRRADLGSKGVYYRAMIGPFESSDEAGQFCNGLKQAGGQCIILRN